MYTTLVTPAKSSAFFFSSALLRQGFFVCPPAVQKLALYIRLASNLRYTCLCQHVLPSLHNDYIFLIVSCGFLFLYHSQLSLKSNSPKSLKARWLFTFRPLHPELKASALPGKKKQYLSVIYAGLQLKAILPLQLSGC